MFGLLKYTTKLDQNYMEYSEGLGLGWDFGFVIDTVGNTIGNTILVRAYLLMCNDRNIKL